MSVSEHAFEVGVRPRFRVLVGVRPRFRKRFLSVSEHAFERAQTTSSPRGGTQRRPQRRPRTRPPTRTPLLRSRSIPPATSSRSRASVGHAVPRRTPDTRLPSRPATAAQTSKQPLRTGRHHTRPGRKRPLRKRPEHASLAKACRRLDIEFDHIAICVAQCAHGLACTERPGLRSSWSHIPGSRSRIGVHQGRS